MAGPAPTLIAKSLPREQQMREAALLTFCDPLPEQSLLLRRLSGGDWQRLLRWMDTSGLALYFLDRMVELRLFDVMPPAVLTRLRQNLIDNTGRMRDLFAELSAIHREFQAARLSYAMLKGFSLWPCSVPKPELRSQLDLDFLVAGESVPDARRVLERRGYRLRAISGRSWEFKTNHAPASSLKDLYKDLPCRSVELHIELGSEGRCSVLGRTEKRSFRGVYIPVLPPADLLLGQALHLYKHVSSEFSRAAHLLEFSRNVLVHRDDAAFWSELRSLAEDNPRAVLGLGLVTLLVTHVMGDFAPEALTSWTVHRLPSSARLWVEMYGCRSVFADFPGSKLYLLLQKELETAGIPAKRSLRRSLLPLKLPPAIAHACPNETLPARFRRCRKQFSFILFRLRFHTVEGLCYMWESIHWRRRMNELAR